MEAKEEFPAPAPPAFKVRSQLTGVAVLLVEVV
jgi:hypothetical protein